MDNGLWLNGLPEGRVVVEGEAQVQLEHYLS